MARDRSASSLLLDECFASQDAAFLSTLRAMNDSEKLAAFADRWKNDPRPWAREQLMAFLEGPLDHPPHKPLIKRLFKHAEQAGDIELVGAFLIAFDRAVRRKRKTRHRWDPASRSVWQEEVLVTPRAATRSFSHHTRYYLRRRAWRYFRRMGFQRPAAYPAAIAAAMKRYRDDDFARGEHLLDSWGAMHALFRRHDVLEFTASHVNLKPGRDLGELTPAPQFLPLWQTTQAVAVLLDLLLTAASRLVRVWGMGMIRRHHGRELAGVGVAELLRCLDHDDEEVQQFGAELLEKLPDLDKLPLATWFALLKTRNIVALETVVRLMRRFVPPGNLTFAQCVDLAIERAVPVARLGLALLEGRSAAGSDDLREVGRLAHARSAVVGKALAAWSLGVLGDPAHYTVEGVIPFFDSLLREVRDGAWEWLGPQSAGYGDPALWSRLLETPYDDTRLQLVAALERCSRLPGTSADQLAPLWCGVLLNIHRGGKQKLAALRQISAALSEDPSRAAILLPVLAVAIRSVRLPEARAGLTAIIAAIESRPQIAPLVAQYLPELQFAEGVGA